ncbi:hypothetical protein FHR99_001437 [Litorivivens lipolytica]|uniref:Outer membrane protein beta-barrel domain-containing protein n=1 Tax=Litorivivens lipolytica TaxID=1524264 RepID=A0A7W4W4B8_9GAMM|nr:outer membrane beta-barrel protein [Litorivivens lipolytica]MBB3047201.1 hypothetical protein [Litorivivens lipolytica]
MIRKTMLASLLVASSFGAYANDLSYSYIEAGVLDVDLDGIDADGFGLNLSAELGDIAFVRIGYGDIETDDRFSVFGFTDEISLSEVSLGIGFHTPLANNVDLVGELSIGRQEVEFSVFEDEETVKGASLGVRGKVNRFVELNAGVGYSDVDDDSETSLGAGIRAYLNRDISLALNYATGDDVDVTTLSARFNF